MRIQKGYVFFAGMALVSIMVLFVIWSVMPIGGETLPHLLERNWQWSFRFSAMLVSVITAIVGVCALVLFATLSLCGDRPSREEDAP